MRRAPDSPRRRNVLAAWLAAAAVAGTAPAFAQDTDRQACVDAAEKGQELLKQRKLLAARSTLGACARDACPGIVRRDCTGWLEQAELAMPTIVVVARDGRGRDVVDGRVLLDGQANERALDGKAIEMDPGPHTIKIVRLGRSAVEETIVVRENEKGRAVVIAVDPPPAAPPPSTSAPPTGHASSTPVAAYVLAGVAVAAGVAGGIFGAKGLSDRSSFGCQSGVGCEHAQYTQVQREFVVSEVALGAAVVSLAVAAVLYFSAK